MKGQKHSIAFTLNMYVLVTIKTHIQIHFPFQLEMNARMKTRKEEL